MIRVSEPYFDQNEIKNVNKAIISTEISGNFGNFIKQFENDFSNYCGTKYGVSSSSGTTALHLAMLAIDLKEGDEVLVSSYTNMATFFSVLYTGAIPVPIDVGITTGNINPELIEKNINRRTKAILVVHIFGLIVDIKPIINIAKKYNLKIIEDCAEAHGATYLNKKSGSFGDIGCFSFYSNKIITTGEGGMAVTNNKKYADKMNSLKNLSFGIKNKFMHRNVGFNYRMTNIQAAIGCAQLKKIEIIIKKKIKIAKEYSKAFKNFDFIQLPKLKKNYRNVYWVYHITLLNNSPFKRKEFMAYLSRKGIETREGFVPFDKQKYLISQKNKYYNTCKNAQYLSKNSLYLPLSPGMTNKQTMYIIKNIITFINKF